MSSVKLLKLKDHLTITEACAYLVGLTGVEDSNVFNYIAGLVNDYKLNLYLNPDRFYEAPYADCGIKYSEVTLVGEQKFIKVYLLRYLTRFDEGEGDSSSQECSFFIEEGSKIEGDVFAGRAFEGGDDFWYNDIPPYLNGDEIAEAHSLACKTYKNKVSEFIEGLHQTDKEEDLFRIDGSNFLYIKRKEIDALLEPLPTKSASQIEIDASPVAGTQDKQEIVILEKIQELGYHPKQLPSYENGKNGVRRELREALKEHDLFQNKTGFTKAWERLSKDSAIKYL